MLDTCSNSLCRRECTDFLQRFHEPRPAVDEFGVESVEGLRNPGRRGVDLLGAPDLDPAGQVGWFEDQIEEATDHVTESLGNSGVQKVVGDRG